VVQKRLSRWYAFGGAWILATAIGASPLFLPYIPDPPLVQALSMFFYGYVVGAIAIATLVALGQYILLRALLGRQSITAALWIPATVFGVVVAVLAIGIWQATVIPALVSFGATRPLMQSGFAGVETMTVLYAIPVAVSMAVSQGVVLSNVFRRNLVRPWLFANLSAALLVVIVQGIQYLEMANLLDSYDNNAATFATAYALQVGGTLLSVVLYAAITGLRLFALARPRNGLSTSSETPSGTLIKRPI
jgi:hypothetical protein